MEAELGLELVGEAGVTEGDRRETALLCGLTSNWFGGRRATMWVSPQNISIGRTVTQH